MFSIFSERYVYNNTGKQTKIKICIYWASILILKYIPIIIMIINHLMYRFSSVTLLTETELTFYGHEINNIDIINVSNPCNNLKCQFKVNYECCVRNNRNALVATKLFYFHPCISCTSGFGILARI